VSSAVKIKIRANKKSHFFGRIICNLKLTTILAYHNKFFFQLFKMTFIKKFPNWFKIKPKLDSLNNRPLFQEREVWNCHWGCNVGFELDGKHEKFIRPVLIFRKLTHNTFLGMPLTTKLKNGSWYVKSKIKNKEGRYIISQIRIIDSKRLYNKIEQITDEEFKLVKQRFLTFIKI
jgi:mRNA interferase MazF